MLMVAHRMVKFFFPYPMRLKPHAHVGKAKWYCGVRMPMWLKADTAGIMVVLGYTPFGRK